MRTLTLKVGLAAALLSLSMAGAFTANSSLTTLQREALENHDVIVPPVSDRATPTRGAVSHAMHPVMPSTGRPLSPPYPGEPRLG